MPVLGSSTSGDFFCEAKWQRCTVHFYRNVFSVTSLNKMQAVAAMLKAIHASEDKRAALEKAEAVYVKLEAMKLKEGGKEGTMPYYDFASEHRIRIRTNTPERIMKEIRRRTRVVRASYMVIRRWCCARLRSDT
jgi:putative transposase